MTDDRASTSVPSAWSRAIHAAGVAAILSAVPIWSALHPAVSVMTLGVGVALTLVRPSRMQRNPRSWGWLLKIEGVVLSISAVVLWLEVSPWIAMPGFAAALVMVLFSSMLSPLPQTGAAFARFAMESTYDAPGHMVKPPGQNVGDPLEGDDGQFLGR